jgi:MFS family permease
LRWCFWAAAWRWPPRARYPDSPPRLSSEAAEARSQTATSSQLLGRVSPPRLAPLLFSIKQTAVPTGLLISGFLVPAMASALGWRGATLVTAAACVAFAAMLQPLRARFDNDRVPSQRFRLSDFRTTIVSVLARDLRRLSFACFAFNGVQSVFTAYFVIYLVAIGYDLAAAGFLFSLVVAVAVPCRVLWGWLGSFHVTPRLVMAGFALGMAGGIVLAGDCSPRLGRWRRWGWWAPC